MTAVTTTFAVVKIIGKFYPIGRYRKVSYNRLVKKCVQHGGEGLVSRVGDRPYTFDNLFQSRSDARAVVGVVAA